MKSEAPHVVGQLRPGDHISLLYETESEHLAVVAPFHRDGLASGDRCIHVAGDVPVEAVCAALRGAGVDVEAERTRSALLVLTPEGAYQRTGKLEPEDMVAFWREADEAAVRDGFGGLRITGDATAALGNGTDAATGNGADNTDRIERLCDYERRIDEVIPGSRMRAICCYNRRQLSARALARMFEMHRRVIFGDRILHSGIHGGAAGDEASMASASGWLEALIQRLERSEETVREALAVKEKLLEVIPAGIYTCDAEGRITSFNQAAAELWGRTPDLGEADEKFCGSFRLYRRDGRPLPHDQTPMAVAVREGEECRDTEVVIERPDGSRITVMVNIALIEGDDGERVGAVNCFVDITDRKRMEARLRQRNRAYYRLLENLPAGAYTCDANGLITYFNQRAVEIWGRAPKLNHPEDRFCASFRLYSTDGSPLRHDECWMALALRTDKDYQRREIVVERPDGSRVTALVHAHPLHDESGALVGAVNVLVDITARERAVEALRAADRRKDEFLAMLSHELRNPLAPIRTCIDVLRLDGETNPRRREALNTLDRQVGTLTRLVDELLDVSRVTTGRIKLERSELDLNDLVQQAVESAESMFEERGQELSIDVSEHAIRVRGDATRLEQVVVNLLSNAAKYTPEGGRIRVSLGQEDDAAVLRVQDSGIGMDAELRSRIFELFSQGEQPLDRRQSGLGIGLPLVKRLVEMHGGELTAASDGPGAGSEFVVRLPVMAAGPDAGSASGSEPGTDAASSVIQAADIAAGNGAPAAGVSRGAGASTEAGETGGSADGAGEAGASEPGTGGEPGASPLRVLVVDDLEEARDMSREILEAYGYEAYTAPDGQSALKAAAEIRPHVVLLDIGLPGMDGYEVARRMREDVGLSDVVLIALTGYGRDSDRQRSIEAGFDHHLVKPVDYSGTVRRMLDSIAENRAG